MRFYPGIEILNLPMLSYTGCHARTVHWLYWNSRAWSSIEVIVMLKIRHHVMSHHSVFRNFCEPFKNHKMQCLMVNKKETPLFV